MSFPKRTSVTKELPEEMLMEILAKLPMKMLMKTSCVCKSWRDLITGNSYFSEKLSESNKNEAAMVIAGCFDYNKPREYRLITRTSPFSFPASMPVNIPETTTLVGSCNGIVCLAHPWRNRWQTVVLYNPVTRQHRVLPPSLLGDDHYNSNYGYQILGFGFDKSSNDYKVVRICYSVRNMDSHAEIYRASANSWRKVEFQNIPLLNSMRFPLSPNGVFLNGKAHWVVSFQISTFDFKTEEFGKMKCEYPSHFTQDLDSPWRTNCVTTVDDSLAVVYGRCGFGVEVWVMQEYGNEKSWTQKFKVQYPSYAVVSSVATSWVVDMNQLIALMSDGKL